MLIKLTTISGHLMIRTGSSGYPRHEVNYQVEKIIQATDRQHLTSEYSKILKGQLINLKN
jgi:hypothetical protein